MSLQTAERGLQFDGCPGVSGISGSSLSDSFWNGSNGDGAGPEPDGEH
jgi:hypothetical protein